MDALADKKVISDHAQFLWSAAFVPLLHCIAHGMADHAQAIEGLLVHPPLSGDGAPAMH